MKIIKKVVRKLCPAFVKRGIRNLLTYKRLQVGYQYDFKRYLRYSAINGAANQAHWDARITALYHVIEKGLSMPESRPGFGEQTAEQLISAIKQYLALEYTDDAACIQSGISAIRSYMAFRQNDGTQISVNIKKGWGDLQKRINQHHDAVVIKKREEITLTSDKPFDVFSAGRHSIRNYSDQTIDESVIKKAVEISQRSPSACNRQSTRIHSIEGDKAIEQVLALQNGNRGFGHLAKRVLIVSADLHAFIGINERNQGFIDGGMFAMSLLYALHRLELGACALNWCATPENDKKLRQLVGIPESEVILMLITVGHIPNEVSIANSQRRPIYQVYAHIHV
jgi:nitroreductase